MRSRGNQHIFFFTPGDDAAKSALNNGADIGKKLLGKKLADGSLPNYELQKNEYVWADFRHGGKTGPWTAKIYGHQDRVVFRRQEIKGASVIRYYEKTEKRIVCLAHWNGAELEVRVGRVGAGGTLNKYAKKTEKKTEQTDESKSDKREIDIRVGVLREFLKDAGVFDKVSPWDLSRACHKMLLAVLAEKKKGILPADSLLPFVTPSVRFRDSAFGSAEFNSQLEEEALTTDKVRTAAISAYLTENATSCRRLIVLWDQDRAGGIWGTASAYQSC